VSKILLAEDDERLSGMIRDWLGNEHHNVEAANNGTDAWEILQSSGFDMLILDWELPGLAGIEICAKYRKSGGMSPVLMLTGKSAIDDKEAGLDAGADDYLTKPFHFKELSARVRALLRRAPQVSMGALSCRGIALDLASFKVTRDGKPIELFPKEFALLEFFLRHPDQVFNLEALQQRIWPTDSESSPETLRVHIARLRSKIEVEGEPAILRTIHRRGYILDTTPVPEQQATPR
jgi:DNA-binding response OmpR family regulator